MLTLDQIIKCLVYSLYLIGNVIMNSYVSTYSIETYIK